MDDISDRDDEELDEDDEGPIVIVSVFYPTWTNWWSKYYKDRNPRNFK